MMMMMMMMMLEFYFFLFSFIPAGFADACRTTVKEVH
jgi:hypothetical protein